MKPETPEQFLEIQKECIKQVRFYVGLAAKKLSVHIPMPTIRFSLNGLTAGRAFYHNNTIKFNPALLRDNVEDFLNRTPGHEVAHLVTRRIHNGAEDGPHGKNWKHVMWAFGLPGIRCHNYDVSSVRGGPSKRRALPVRTEDSIIIPKSGFKITTFE